MWIHAAAKGRARVMNLLDQVMSPGCDAAHDVGVPTEIFRSRMQYQVNAPLCRTAIDGGGERRINGREQTVFSRKRSNPFQIDDPYGWICRRLDVKKFRIRADRSFMLFNVVGIDERGL